MEKTKHRVVVCDQKCQLWDLLDTRDRPQLCCCFLFSANRTDRFSFFLTEIRFCFIFFPTLRTIFFSVIKFGLQLTVLVVSP